MPLKLSLLFLFVVAACAQDPVAKKPGARMAKEQSLYLQQHAGDPVAWFPWGDEAFEKAKKENKPVFLSSGYSACHWCHVMQRESFQNEEIAAILNRAFVSIKIDREERPDVDRIYMEACQRYSRFGAGWPLSAWLLPDRKPFLLGTYFPPEPGRGRPGFKELLLRIEEQWKSKPDDVAVTAQRLAADLAAQQIHTRSADVPDLRLINRARYAIENSEDRKHGGFGTHPKFPKPSASLLILRHAARDPEGPAAESIGRFLDAILAGGIHDHLAGGFHRYCVDEAWLIPHFEKMLYDQAQLAWVLLEAAKSLGQERYRAEAHRTLDWCLRDMQAPGGGFHTSLDAVTGKVEGGTYVWTKAQIDAVLTKSESATVCAWSSATDDGNWENGVNILHAARSIEEVAKLRELPVEQVRRELEAARSKLLAEREKRAQPRKDTKILTGWNGLLIATLARAGRESDLERFTQAARRAFAFVDQKLGQPNGRYLRSFAGGVARHEGELSDHAAMLHAALALHEATLEPSYLARAKEIANTLLSDFTKKDGRMVDASRGDLIVEQAWLYDGPQPSGTALALYGLTRLAHLTANEARLDQIAKTYQAIGGWLQQQPAGGTFSLIGLDLLVNTTLRVEYHGDFKSPAIKAMRSAVAQSYLPFIVETGQGDEGAEDSFVTVCVGETCLLPARTPDELRERIAAALEL